MQRGWTQQLQRRLQWLQQQRQQQQHHHHHHDGGGGGGARYYVVDDDDDDDGIEAHNIGNGTAHHDCIYYPFSYVMVGDGGREQEQQHHRYVYPQTMTTRPPPPPTPAPPSSLPPLPVSSPPPRPLPQSSYFERGPSAQTAQQQHRPVAPPPTSTSTGCNTVQQHRLYTNPYDYNEGDNGGAMAVGMVTANGSSSCFCRLQLKERTVSGSGMTSTVVVNNNDHPSQRRRSSADDETVAETMSPSASEQRREVKNQIETTVNDDKVVSVCKRTITATIQKILVDDYGSALYKLRKTIRILDILMFAEGSSGIGSAKIETVRPWLDTLKDMEQQLSSKQNRHQNHDDSHHGHGNRAMTRVKHDYLQVRKRKRYNSGCGSSGNISIRCNRSYSNGSNRDGSGGTRRNCWPSNTRRYRTTGKLITGQYET